MPGYEDVNVNFTMSSYQSADGTNFSTAGYDLKFKGGTATYIGIGTNFHSKPVGVIDFKASGTYGKESNIGQNLRIRTKFDTEMQTTQIRFSPCTVNVPLGEKTSAYVNPHYVGTYDYQNKKWTNAAGIFGGVTQKISDKTSISLEAQRYNLDDIKDNSGKNWSINAIVSVKL